MITVKLYDLENARRIDENGALVDVYDEFAKIPVKASLAFAYQSRVRKIREALKDCDNTRNELIKKYGKTADDGTVTVSQENYEPFMKEVHELLLEEVELDFTPIPLERLDESGVMVNSKWMSALWFLFSED